MPLREFDRVRERLEFRLEKRHLIWLLASVVVILVATFVGGWIVASKLQPRKPLQRVPQSTNWVSVSRLPAPTQRAIQTRRLPVVPRVRSAGKRRMVPLYELRPSR
ncbi:MAG TPA: hypothetical protein DCQ06_04265, partial [Myxococcales bacterium]|nr:hypothetical protein [Myxococcales bacterium]